MKPFFTWQRFVYWPEITRNQVCDPSGSDKPKNYIQLHVWIVPNGRIGYWKWACQISLGSFQMQSSVCHQYGRPSGGPSKNFSCWLSHVLASIPLRISMWTCLNYLEVPMFRDPEKDRNPTRMACWLNLKSESVTVPIGCRWIHASPSPRVARGPPLGN